MVNMAVPKFAFARQKIAARPAALPRARSSLVRRLVAAENDPAKRRIRAWLANLEDEGLSSLGLTPQDIVILRGGTQRPPEISQPDVRTNGGSVAGLRPTLRKAARQIAAADLAAR